MGCQQRSASSLRALFGAISIIWQGPTRLGPARYDSAGHGATWVVNGRDGPLLTGWANFSGDFGMNAHTLRAHQTVDRIASAWRGAPKITVVQAPSDLPVPAPSDARGMHYKRDTWVVSDTQPANQVGETLAHEAIGHFAMRDTLGGSWRPFMHAVQDGIRSGDWRLACFRQTVCETYVDDSGECNLSTVHVSDEISAAVVEARFDSDSGRLVIQQPMRKAAKAVAGHFAREGLYADVPASFDQLEGALLIAEHSLRHDGLPFGLVRRLNRWYAAAMTKPWNPKAPPMSLHESQNLLNAEKSRQSNWNGMIVVGQFLLVGFGIAVILYVLFGLVFGPITTWR